MSDDKTPDEIYDEFWKDLVETDGVMDPEKVKAELADYSFLMHEVPKVYSEVTSFRVSKPNTMAFEVIAEHDRSCYYRERLEAAHEAIRRIYESGRAPEMSDTGDWVEEFDLATAEMEL